MIADDDRRDPRNRAIFNLQEAERGLVAMLRVDRAHPFFFDHPLDHLPGLLLLEGALQLARQATGGGLCVARFEAQFIKFALMNEPVAMLARRIRGKRLAAQCVGVDVVQGGVRRASIRATFRASGAPAARTGSIAAPAPCPAAPLNKHNPCNVLITEPRRDGGRLRAGLLPRTDLCMLTDSGAALHPLHLLEAFMQTQRWLNHHAAAGGRMRDLLIGATLALPTPVPAGADLSLDCAVASSALDPRRAGRDGWALSDGRRVAHFSIQTARAGVARSAA